MPASTVPGMVPTDDGVGDLLFPSLGNPGIDVLHYDVDISYDPDRDAIDGVVGLDLLLTEARSEITLDAVNLKTWEVTVNGEAVAAEDDSPELRIPLPAPGRRRRSAAGGGRRTPWSRRRCDLADRLPERLVQHRGRLVRAERARRRAQLDAVQRPPERQGHATRSRSRCRRAPRPWPTASSVEQRNDGRAATTWVWQEDRPMTTYLILLLTGDYEIVDRQPDRTDCRSCTRCCAPMSQQMQPYLDITARADRVLRRRVRPVPARPLRHRHLRQLRRPGDGDAGTLAVQPRRLPSGEIGFVPGDCFLVARARPPVVRQRGVARRDGRTSG